MFSAVRTLYHLLIETLFPPRAELVPVPGPAKLSGSFGPVWDRLHCGLGLYSPSLLRSLSTHHCLISSLE